MDPTQDTRTDLFLTPSHILESDLLDTVFSCTHCGEKFIWKENYIAHQNSHRIKITYYHKDYSKRAFSDKTKYLAQKEKFSMSFTMVGGLFATYDMHGGMESNMNEKKSSDQQNAETYQETSNRYRCQICGNEFLCLTSLVFHGKNLGCVPKFKCTKCSTVFLKKESLDDHIKTHVEPKCYRCIICDKIYYREHKLKSHVKQHKRERRFLCEDCGKIFTKLSNFCRHLRMHDLDKSFHCDFCGKRFIYESYLMSHQEVHSEQRDYICDQCGRQYKRQSSLARHQKFRHGLTQ